jgi:hypothetical protein
MPYFKNDNINILFIHIPKTGGSSLENYFSLKFGIELNKKSLHICEFEQTKLKNDIIINSSLQHLTYKNIFEYQKEFNVDFNNIKIITIVRNPYERIISDLFFFNKINIDSSKEEVFNIITEYLLSDNLDNHNIPQYLFITDYNKVLIPNIHILHTETLTTDMHDLGYQDFNNYDNVNKKKIDYYKYLNNDSINLINYFYNYDFKLFNYKQK